MFLIFTHIINHILSFMSLSFSQRHIGPNKEQVESMLSSMGFSSLDDIIKKIIPKSILSDFYKNKFDNMSETEALVRLKEFGNINKVYSSFIGQGYYNTYTPAVIKRNILENPGWYTQYTPY